MCSIMSPPYAATAEDFKQNRPGPATGEQQARGRGMDVQRGAA
jgi:hypothetical protein